MQPASVLVSGASGFLGRQAVTRLSDQGFRVRTLSRKACPQPGAESFLLRDSLDTQTMDTATRGVEAVIHLAGLAHVPAWKRALLPWVWNRRMREAHVRPSERLATAAVRHGVRRFIFVSSLAAAASSSETPVQATTLPRPAGAYGRAKLLAEERLQQICAGTATGLVTVRPPMIYGRGCPGNATRLADWIRKGGPVPVPAQPNPRSFLYVENFVSLLEAILKAPDEPGWPVLVQDERPLSTEELATLVGQAIGKPARIWRLSPGQIRILGGLTLGTVSEKLCGKLTVDPKETERFYRWTPPVKVEEAVRRSFGGGF